MGLLDKFSLAKLKRHYGSISDKGRAYFEEGRVHDRVRTGDGLRARVDGTYTYSVSVRERGNSLSTLCSCPYRGTWGGDCKHIEAVLLAWAKEPETFKRVEDWRETLAQKSKEELLEILLEILDGQPELVEELGLEAKDLRDYDAGAAVRTILSDAVHEELDITEIVERLDRVAKQAVKAQKNGDLNAARKIYFALIKGCLDFCDQYGASEMFMDADALVTYAEVYAAIVNEQGMSSAIRKELKTIRKSDSSEIIGVSDALWEISSEDE